MKFKVIDDAGKPFEYNCDGEEALKKVLTDIFIDLKTAEAEGDDYPRSLLVFDENNVDVTYSPLIDKLMNEVITKQGERIVRFKDD